MVFVKKPGPDAKTPNPDKPEELRAEGEGQRADASRGWGVLSWGVRGSWFVVLGWGMLKLCEAFGLRRAKSKELRTKSGGQTLRVDVSMWRFVGER